MATPFDSEDPERHEPLLAVDKAGLVVLLQRIARELTRLENSPLQDGEETLGVWEAARAVQLALVALGTVV
jgi:hypothetical protein